MAAKSPKPKGGRQRICVFCEQGDICHETYGRLLSKAGITAHYFCMLFSSGLSQNGKSEKEGILGFLPSDIVKEVKRGSKLRCSYCKKVGATIGCVIRNCKKMFHLGCGRTNKAMHQFFGTFSSFCPAHRMQQNVPSDDDPSIVCSICMNTVTAAPSCDTLRAPCCRKYWYHRDCVQRYATSAGLYFFKCPLCNNKDEFQDEMLNMGIYIPDQDASWEKEPHAFQELLERYSHCDAPVCKCVEGRKYDKEGSKWEIILCDFCGSHGAHVACNHMEKLGKNDICHGCKEVDERTREEEYLLHSPPHKRKSLELLQLELSSSPDTSKGTSPYPGPSDSMKKVGLPSPKTSKRQSVNNKRKSSVAKGKRMASPENTESPHTLKRQKMHRKKCATMTSTGALGHRTRDSLTSPTTSSQSSEDSSDEETPNGMSKHKLSKMTLESAWDVRRRKRLENRKRNEMKKGQTNNTTESEIDMKGKGTNKKKVDLITLKSGNDTAEEMNRKLKNTKNSARKGGCKDSTKNIELSDTNMDAGKEMNDSVKMTALGKHKPTELPLPGVNDSEKGKKNGKEKEKLRRVTADATLLAAASGIEDKGKQVRRKRSLEYDKTQMTLTSWLKPKQDMVKQENIKRSPVKASEPKNPVVIEWKGKQLIIRSPKVVLNRSRSKKTLKMRPKNLKIDMNDAKGCAEWNREIDLLSNLETDVRVTRKMIDIDRLDNKNDRAVKYLRSPARQEVKQEKTQYISPSKKRKTQENSVKSSAVSEVNNNEVLGKFSKEKTGKAVHHAQDRLNDEKFTDIKYNCVGDFDGQNTQIGDKVEDSPVQNLRGRKTRRNVSNTVSANSLEAKLIKENEIKKSPRKSTSSSKSVVPDSPKSRNVSIDSPAKNLRERVKKGNKDSNILEMVENSSLVDTLEKENQLTPTIENKKGFNFTVKGKRSCDTSSGTVLPYNPEIKSNEKESLSAQSLSELNNEMNDHFKKQKMFKQQISLSGHLGDSPAKNLRKRIPVTNKDSNDNVNTEVNKEEQGSRSHTEASPNQIEKLKRHKPRFISVTQCNETDLMADNSLKEKEHVSDMGKEVGKDMSDSAKEAPKVKEVEKQQSILWYFEGTKQLEEDPFGRKADFLVNGSCENTCPNPQPVGNGAYREEAKTGLFRRKSLTLDDILEKNLAEIDSEFPNVASGSNSSETSPESNSPYLEKTRRQFSGTDSLSSKLSIVNGSIVYKSTSPSSRADNPGSNFPQSSRTLLDAMRNKVVTKLRSSPRSKNSLSSSSSVHNHVSDKSLMAEYYGAELNKEQEQTESGDADDDSNDIVELPSFIKAGIL